MKLYDISQEIFSCVVFPGDPAPEKQTLCATEKGELYNLTAFSMCAHNGTHVDAPFHFLSDGKTVDEMDLETFVGPCWVARHSGDVSAQDATSILGQAGGAERILIAGPAVVTAEAARVFAVSGIRLIGRTVLRLKLQYFGHLMRRADSLGKTLMLAKIEGRRRSRQQRMRWLNGIPDQWT